MLHQFSDLHQGAQIYFGVNQYMDRASKYKHLKKVLKVHVKLPSCELVSKYRKEITLKDEIEIVRDSEGFSIGTCVAYHSILKLTVERLVSTLEPIPS